ncbi:aldehyde dehydrogenase family protein [Polaromonas sp. P1(28)-13]|nr:aldehyde dehydrogenase family protein [Polaromonas sp. P1(28)-13]
MIDREAFDSIQNHLQRLNSASKVLSAHKGRAQVALDLIANSIAPAAFEVSSLAEVKDEIFGPVLQIVRWGSGALKNPEAVMARINALGYGLTLGIQTRIDSRAQALAAAAHVGNIYVNRNMIGAVVGVQPFGGEGLSGTGPKAGGPHYLLRFCAEQTLTVNTTAAGEMRRCWRARRSARATLSSALSVRHDDCPNLRGVPTGVPSVCRADAQHPVHHRWRTGAQNSGAHRCGRLSTPRHLGARATAAG